ncbi:photosynthetic complex putative assembly protein PuhB [Sphingomonas sp. 1P06PA]|uniref:photosynthetic complex putative assembly protein PuhB n=1 Tax=Sphingomonas sp. 1P06PA TaxID=554121 RepID=UPI0039A6284C
MSEYEHEPVPGLPGVLPAGERMLWQGAPDRALLARTAFHTRKVAFYFAVLTGFAFVTAVPRLGEGAAALLGTAATALVGLAGIGLLHLLAWVTARATIYTLTDRRVVLRIGVAIPKCINLPLAKVAAIDLRGGAGDSGDVALKMTGMNRIGYAVIWPHARPGRIAVPQPMLRALPDAATVAGQIAEACRALGGTEIAEIAAPAPKIMHRPIQVAA